MRRLEHEACSACDTELGGTAIIWCSGCLRPLCPGCAEMSASCDECDMLVCEHCALRLFTLECAACGYTLHYDCVTRRGDPSARVLCVGCAREAEPREAEALAR